MNEIKKELYPPNESLNIGIAIAAYSTAIGLLYAAAHAQEMWVVFPCVILFSYIGNTIFSLLHESVHRSFSQHRLVNDIFGVLSAGFFPTGFTFQRICHLGHHRRNRTDVEMFDMYYESDSRILKYSQLYTVLTGLYWTSAPFGCILYLCCPWLLNTWLLRGDNDIIKHMGADAMLSGFDGNVNKRRIRLEILYTVIFQASLFYFLGLTWWSWLACYWAFAMNWGALQYADHAWSVRDIRMGAWNLRVNKLVQYVFLNYHHHAVHHQHPQLPWIHLGKFVDKQQPRPSFLKIYLRMWKGPTPANQPAPASLAPEFEKVIYDS